MTGFTLTAAGKYEILKDPDALLDYSFDWTAWLAVSDPADTIASHVVSLSGSATAVLENSAEDSGVVTAWVSGGAIGDKIAVTCHITSASGREDDRTVYLKVKER